MKYLSIFFYLLSMSVFAQNRVESTLTQHTPNEESAINPKSNNSGNVVKGAGAILNKEEFEKKSVLVIHTKNEESSINPSTRTNLVSQISTIKIEDTRKPDYVGELTKHTLNEDSAANPNPKK